MIFSYFLFIPDCLLGNCTFPDTYSFFLHCPFYWHIVVCSNLLWPFVFLWYWLWLLFFQLWFYLHEPSLFFLMSLAQVLSVLLISKYQLFFHWSCLLFLVSTSLMSAPFAARPCLMQWLEVRGTGSQSDWLHGQVAKDSRWPAGWQDCVLS